MTGVTSATVKSGASGIWLSWMWMFGTPFYWIIAPIVRRMRSLTLADYFEERFGKAEAFFAEIDAAQDGGGTERLLRTGYIEERRSHGGVTSPSRGPSA